MSFSMNLPFNSLDTCKVLFFWMERVFFLVRIIVRWAVGDWLLIDWFLTDLIWSIILVKVLILILIHDCLNEFNNWCCLHWFELLLIINYQTYQTIQFHHSSVWVTIFGIVNSCTSHSSSVSLTSRWAPGWYKLTRKMADLGVKEEQPTGRERDFHDSWLWASSWIQKINIIISEFRIINHIGTA